MMTALYLSNNVFLWRMEKESLYHYLMLLYLNNVDSMMQLAVIIIIIIISPNTGHYSVFTLSFI